MDNLLRPLLVGQERKMPDYLILITTLGGMELYGINGFVIGPLIAALFIPAGTSSRPRPRRQRRGADADFIEEEKTLRISNETRFCQAALCRLFFFAINQGFL